MIMENMLDLCALMCNNQFSDFSNTERSFIERQEVFPITNVPKSYSKQNQDSVLSRKSVKSLRITH